MTQMSKWGFQIDNNLKQRWSDYQVGYGQKIYVWPLQSPDLREFGS